MSTLAQLVILGLIIYGIGYWRGYKRGSGAITHIFRNWLK